jgi:hypothetical protein
MYIGIDPDTEKSGFAIWQNKELFLYNLSFPKVQEFLLENKDKIKKVVISAGWLNKTNYHAKCSFNKSVNSIIGERVGANHQIGKLIAEYCEHYNITFELSKPKAKKLDAETFKNITKFDKRTNQEQRDAGILVFGL